MRRRAFEGERPEVNVHEGRDHRLNALQHQRSAVSPHDRRPHREMTPRVLEHREAEAETPRGLALAFTEEIPQVFEPAGEQGLLVGEMRVERGPADVRPVDDVLNGRGFVPLLDHH